ncbi:unnamed protein product [Lota lota]
MMRALGGMVVVVILLVRTHCEVRARDPGEEGETGGDAGGTGVGGEGTEGAGGWEQKDLLNGPETTQPPGPESQRPPESLPARTGNWCAYVQQRVVTSVVKCGTEKYTIRSPCPPETPNCQLVMFQASSRPVYRQQQQMFTALQWRCCPGHGGLYCQDSGDLLVPVVAALVMAQLNPVLEGFNRSLLLLDGRVGALARDLAQWRPGAAREHSESRLEEVLEEVQEVRLLLDSQRTALEERLHSQHAMLHYNLTSFKTEVDVKLKRTGKMMQTSIQGMNASLVDLQAHQEQMGGAGARSQGPSSSPLHPSPAQETTWTNHLNTKLSALEEDLKENARSVGDLRETLLELEERIAQTGRDSQVQFMETGLDVEEAREVVLGRVREMERNISLVVQQTQALDTDVDFLFTLVYNCTTLRDEVAHLERGVANLTELANEKRLAPEEGGQWAPLVKELQLSLQQVKDSLAAEQGAGLQEEMRRLSGSFNALLKDAVRHSDVLEILLGEDVLEFLRWTPPQQEAHSIPALKEQMRSLQEKMMGHNHSLSTLQRDRAESSMADQPLSAEGEVRRRSHAPRREQQLLMATDPADGGGGALEKVVEELEVRVQALEEHGGGAQEEQLQEEVLWLRRAVEDHLRVFKKVFSQAETLEDSHRTLDLQDLWTLTQDSRRERRRGGERRRGDKDGERRRGDKDGEVRREALRSRRDITASPPQPQSSPLLLATWMIGLRGEGRFLVFRASLNVGGVYSETSGRFTAPQTGLYLLLLTLDLRPGHTHLLLRRWSGKELCLLQKEVMEDTGALSFLRLLHLEEKEELSVELRAGGLLESSSNVLAVMLLH